MFDAVSSYTHRHPVPEWAQRALDVPYQSHRLDVEGAPIHYLSWGVPGRPTVLLVHGTAAHAQWWRFVAPCLLPDYHVVAMDLGGMGDSGARATYAPDDFMVQVMAMVRHVSVGQPIYVVGHSLGGYVTIRAGHHHGEALAGAIVVDSPIHPPGQEPERSWRLRAELPSTVYPSLEMAVSRFRLLPEQVCAHAFIVEHVALHSAKPDGARGWTWKFDPKAFGALTRRNHVEALSNMRCPTALFWGERSALFTPALRAYVRETFGARLPLVEIADAYHHVLLDQPIALAAAIRTQLANWALATR